MLQSEKVDFKRFYKFKNIQKWYFIHDFFSGTGVPCLIETNQLCVLRYWKRAKNV